LWLVQHVMWRRFFIKNFSKIKQRKVNKENKQFLT